MPTERELREDLAAAYRLVALFGMTDLVFTHLSARLPGEGHRFLINPYGMLFEEITACSLVEVDAEGEPPQADRLAGQPGRLRHPFRGASRPRDAACVMHTHTLAGMAVAAQTGGLLPLNQISMEFDGRVALPRLRGRRRRRQLTERERLVRDLGDKPLHDPAQPRPADGRRQRRRGLLLDVVPGAVLPHPARGAVGRRGAGHPVARQVERTPRAVQLGPTKGWLPWQALKRKLDREQPAYRD